MTATLSDAERANLERLRLATRLLFWTLLLVPIGANLAAFGSAFGTGAVWFLIYRLIKILGGIALVLGARVLTVSGNRILPQLQALGATLLGLAGVKLVMAFLISSNVASNLWWLPNQAVTTIGIVLGIALLRRISVSFGETLLSRALVRYAVAYVLFQIAEAVWSEALHSPGPFLIGTIGEFLILTVWPGLWGLRLLGRFREMLRRILCDSCLQCGYSLRGLPLPRCPECGRLSAAGAD